MLLTQYKIYVLEKSFFCISDGNVTHNPVVILLIISQLIFPEFRYPREIAVRYKNISYHILNRISFPSDVSNCCISSARKNKQLIYMYFGPIKVLETIPPVFTGLVYPFSSSSSMYLFFASMMQELRSPASRFPGPFKTFSL